jgi:hypothetical protein
MEEMEMNADGIRASRATRNVQNKDGIETQTSVEAALSRLELLGNGFGYPDVQGASINKDVAIIKGALGLD